jgi:pyruvate dehydrogenase E1 component beta subunit
LEGPRVVAAGNDLTIVASGFSTQLALSARDEMLASGFHVEVVDLRVLNPINPTEVLASVVRTGRLLVVDGGWRTCGMAGEVIALVSEGIAPSILKKQPVRITLPDAPAPTSRVLEQLYYPAVSTVVSAARRLLN